MSRKCVCDDTTLTDQEKWRNIVGTENYGNLPEYKANNHVGKLYAPCPYSTQSNDLRTILMLGIPEGEALPTKVDHTGDNGATYYMIETNSGVWGFSCTYSGCPFLLNNGRPYFSR